ncbi:MAG TPA: outer membrane lipoprotein-sorting protein [Verrucomicrobiae bacterium]
MGVLLCGVIGGVVFGAAPPLLNDPIEGQNLAREIRALVPTESARFAGVLRIASSRAEPREVPIRSAVAVDGTNWNSTYEARRADSPLEVLVIRHSLGQPNEYEWRRGDQVVKFEGGKATNGFAGSDFALLDLGLEFFNWPTQVVVMREMRKGRGCDVLESRPAQPGLYSRIVSWIDQESRAQGQPGLLMAEGYDRNGKLLKEFEIKSFKKVAGRWEVSEMEIRNRQTKGSTRLQFEFSQ